MSLAIVPGSFDPMTLGHLDIITAAARRYDSVVVAVMINPAKKYRFSLEERVKIAEVTVKSLPNVRVISDRGLLIDLFDRLHADVVCRGWRDDTDYAYEMHMADWNRSHNPRFCTELIRCGNGHLDISSTRVRSLLEEGREPVGLVHPDALPLLLPGGERKEP